MQSISAIKELQSISAIKESAIKELQSKNLQSRTTIKESTIKNYNQRIYNQELQSKNYNQELQSKKMQSRAAIEHCTRYNLYRLHFLIVDSLIAVLDCSFFDCSS